MVLPFIALTDASMNNPRTRSTMAAARQLAPIHVIKRVWERIAPLQLAEKGWDNVGGTPSDEVVD